MSSISIEDFSIDKSDWGKVKFGDVVFEPKESVKDPVAEGIEHVVGLEHIDSEDIHLRKSASIEESTTFTKKFSSGDVLFGRRRAYLKKAAQAKFEGICSGDITLFRAKSDLLPELLPFLVNNDRFFDHAITHSAGGLSPRVKFKDLSRYELLLPPKKKQADLSKLLLSIDDVLNKHLRLRKKIRFASKCFTRKFFKQECKAVAYLGEIAEVRYGITVNSKRNTLPMKKPYLRVANVGRGFVDETEMKILGCSNDEFSRYRLSHNDTLIVEGHANIREIGRAALWTGTSKDTIHQNHLIRVRCNSNEILPEILTYYINSSYGKLYFQRHAKSTSGLNTINSSVVKKLKIPLISLVNQKKYLQGINLLEQQIKEINEHIINSKLLLKSLLGQIF